MQQSLNAALSIVGGPQALAIALGITSQAISQWKRVPASRVIAVEKATGVSRHVLRPDIYPRDEPAPIGLEQAA